SASSLDDVAGALETAKSEVTTICNLLIEYAEDNADDRDAVIAEVSKAIEAAEPHKTSAGTAVTSAMNKIDGYLDGHESTFAAINAPGDETFVPGPDNIVHWEPAPLPRDFPTTYSSADDGSGPAPHTGSTSYASYASYAGGSGGPPQPIPFAPGTATGDRIIEAARLHLGKPYVWGANGPNAFDCSGLVYYTLNQAGVKIGDTTAAGYQASGTPVSGPQPGDMVFFGHPAGHVGIYICDGQMIHAPRPGSSGQAGSAAADGRPVSYRRFTWPGSCTMRTVVPEGSRRAQSRRPRGRSMGSWRTSAPEARTLSKVASRSSVRKTTMGRAPLARSSWRVSPSSWERAACGSESTMPGGPPRVTQRQPSAVTSSCTSRPSASR